MAETSSQQQQAAHFTTTKHPHTYGSARFQQPIDAPVDLLAAARAKRPDASGKAQTPIATHRYLSLIDAVQRQRSQQDDAAPAEVHH
jgi:hypothetical protein